MPWRSSVLCLILSCTLINYVAGKEEKIVLTYGHLRTDFAINGKTDNMSTSLTPKEWIMPDNKKVALDSKSAKMKIFDDGWILLIVDLHDKDLGTYQLVMTDSKTKGTKKNKWTLMMMTEWERYRNNTIIGCIAGVACLGTLVVICLVYHFRWRSPEDQKDYAKHYVHKESIDRGSFSHDNPVFSNDI